MGTRASHTVPRESRHVQARGFNKIAPSVFSPLGVDLSLQRDSAQTVAVPAEPIAPAGHDPKTAIPLITSPTRPLHDF
jgi:hypothetical protein